jgi:PAS domain S-box-containing protein
MRILIVDDDRDSRMIIKKNLEHKGYKVQEASNGVDALKLMRESEESGPDMIISDILMPEMDGFRLCHEVKQDNKLRKIPFIFYTATYDSPEDEKLAMNLGASRFIIKPIEMVLFHTIINEVIGVHEKEKLHVPRMPLEGEFDLSRMYKDSIVRKLDDKVRELELYKYIFSNSIDAIAIIDQEGTYIKQNPAHRELLGYSDEELEGKTPAIHLGEDVFLDVFRKLSEQGVCHKELRSETKAGQSIYIDLLAFPIKNKKGEVICYVGIKRNISSQIKIEKELRVRIKELEDFYQMAVSREVKMKQLKEKISKLESELSQYKK